MRFRDDTSVAAAKLSHAEQSLVVSLGVLVAIRSARVRHDIQRNDAVFRSEVLSTCN